MELHLIHMYPDLMDLYGSRANLLVLRRTLEAMGNTVTIVPVHPGEEPDLSQADFLYMGAGTERAQKAVLEDFIRYKDAIHQLSRTVPQLFCGNSMELLGKTIVDADGKSYEGLGLGEFVSTQGKRRIVGDVIGTTVFESTGAGGPLTVVGFMNKCSTITGVNTPLLASLTMGFGNEAQLGPEGFFCNRLLASELTGPILVKNPQLLQFMVALIYGHHGQFESSMEIPVDHWAEEGYQITLSELQNRLK